MGKNSKPPKVVKAKKITEEELDVMNQNALLAVHGKDENVNAKAIAVYSRRKTILDLFLRGFSQRAIAEELGVHPITVFRDLAFAREEIHSYYVKENKNDILAELFAEANRRKKELWKIVDRTKSDARKQHAIDSLRDEQKTTVTLLQDLSVIPRAPKTNVYASQGDMNFTQNNQEKKVIHFSWGTPDGKRPPELR